MGYLLEYGLNTEPHSNRCTQLFVSFRFKSRPNHNFEILPYQSKILSVELLSLHSMSICVSIIDRQLGSQYILNLECLSVLQLSWTVFYVLVI